MPVSSQAPSRLLHPHADPGRPDETRCAPQLTSQPSKTYRLIRPTASRSGQEKRFGTPFRALTTFLPTKDILLQTLLLELPWQSCD